MVTNKEFTEIILHSKTLYFSEEVLTEPENYPLVLSMTSAGIRWFTIDFEKYPINDLQDALKDKFYISSYSTWKDSLVYLKNIVSFFTQEGKELHYDTSEFLKNQLSTSILRDFIGSDTDFLEKYLSESNDKEIDSIFLSGLISISFEANFPINLIIQLFKKVIDLQLDDSHFRIDWHTIIFGLAANYPNKGKEIIQHLKIDLEPQYEQLIGQITGGVCSTSLIENIAFFKELYQEDKFQGWILWGMTRIEKALSEEDSIKMLDLAETNSQEVGVLCNLMRFYIITLAYNSINEKVSSRCYKGIKQLLNQENPHILYSFLNNTTYTSKLPEKDVCELFKVFLRNPNHPVEVFSANGSNIHRFDWCLQQSIKTPEYFFEVLFSFINDTSHQFSIDVFNQSLPIILKTYPVESMRFILECLTDYSGRLRHLGHTLLEEQLKIHPDVRFGNELQALTIEKQTILVLSVAIPQTLDFAKLFRCVIPLLAFEVESITMLILKIIFEKANMTGSLDVIVQDELSDCDLKKDILKLLTEKYKYYNEIQHKKENLKEFKPFYVQQKLFSYYNKALRESLDKKFQKIMKENSLTRIFGDNNIILLKGGGFKSEFNSEFTPLSNIQNSFTIPVSAFLDSEQQLWDTSIFFNEKWETANDWKEWLRKF
jgi:hypothetical protein